MITSQHLQTPISDTSVFSDESTRLGIENIEVTDIAQDEALRHPLGVKPSGNALTATQNLQQSMGYFGILPDSTVVTLLEYLDGDSLVRLGSACRGLYAYCTYDQLWRDICVNRAETGFKWRGSWRTSVRQLSCDKHPKIDCSNLFSDAIHRPFLCSQISPQRYAYDIPLANKITRLKDLTQEEFAESWTNRPFILTEPVKRWKLYEDWCEEDLLRQYGKVCFRAEAVDWPLRTYVEYMNNNNDESPLYLFDRGFVDKMGLEVGPSGAYQPPECFGSDLFAILEESRPDYRWLIVGPARSGSTFHKDPNATSAWNAVIRGSKYWIMFPSSIIPPGVYMSEDQSEVTSPLSIAEWLLTFHEEARQISGCREGVCGKGEVLHVPSGWWHLVVNLEPAIAITQNFVPRSHLTAAMNFLKNKSDQVSGFKDDIDDPHALFIEKLQKAYPELLTNVDLSFTKKRKWEDIVAEQSVDADGTGGFSFGFGDDIDEDES